MRKLTRAIADVTRGQMTEYLATLTPLMRPATVFGEYVQGGQREPTRRAEKALKELQGLYERVATVAPFNLPRELRPPFNVGTGGLEITPVEYAHAATAGADTRTITVRSPLTWTLSYTDCPPARLHELLTTRLRSNDELQKVVVSYLVMHVVATSQPGLRQILEALRVPLSSVKAAGLGELPITRIGLAIATSRPSDAVIIESAELTGMDAFEEVVAVADIERLRDPLRERLLALAREHTPDHVKG